jgi:hypothetical protein
VADNEEGADLTLSISCGCFQLLLLIMVSGENLIERARTREEEKAKISGRKTTGILVTEFLGRLYQSAISDEVKTGGLTQRPDWRRGHIKSQPHGPRHSLREIIQGSKAQPATSFSLNR